MPEYLVLMKLNPAKLAETLDALRKMEQEPVAGVNLQYSVNIFGSWDAGLWVSAEEPGQTLQFVQKKLKGLSGVTDVYPIATFPHGNRLPPKSKGKEADSKQPEPKVTEA
jgi:hypothetical protein